MFKKGGWVIGGENETRLVNKEGEEEANRATHEEKRVTSAHRSGYLSGRPADESKNCAIM